jgi:DNA-binding transcriptional LysR family regulator
MDRLDILRTFVAVAEQASFAKAARSLRISPTAATRAVAALEKELGVAVFRRTTRSVGLTEEGAAFLERCRPALAELEEATRSVRGENSEPRGTLVMTAPVVFGRMYIRPLATELLRLHPKLSVQLILTDRICRLVDEGIDLALRIAELSDSALRAVRIGEVRRVLVASPTYLSTRGMPKTVAALREHDLIAFESFTQNGEWRFAGPGRSGIRLQPRLLTDSVDVAIDAALEGRGITRVLSYQVMDHLDAGRLLPILEAFVPSPVPVSLLYQANRQHSPNVRAMIEAAKEYLRSVRLS